MQDQPEHADVVITIRRFGLLRVAFEAYSGPVTGVAKAAIALQDRVQAAGVPVIGAPVALFPTADQNPTSVMVRLCIPVPAATETAGLRYFDLEPVDVVNAEYRGPYAEIGRAYDALSNWVDEHQATVGEGISETYRRGPRGDAPEDAWEVDVAIRLRRPGSGGFARKQGAAAT